MTVGILMPEEEPENDPFSDSDIFAENSRMDTETVIKVYMDKGLAGFTEFVLNQVNYRSFRTYGENPEGSILLRFFEDTESEKMLSEIRKKNEQDKSGKFFLAGTHIELLNYSYCPSCKKIYSFTDLSYYYNNPAKSDRFAVRAEQLRRETAVCCSVCRTYFMPSLIILHKEPVAEIQYLCRMQTIEWIEQFYFGKFGKRVLSKKPKNRQEKEGKKFIMNDVFITELAERPALILNLLRYSSADLQINIINEENVLRKDILFGPLKYFPD